MVDCHDLGHVEVHIDVGRSGREAAWGNTEDVGHIRDVWWCVDVVSGAYGEFGRGTLKQDEVSAGTCVRKSTRPSLDEDNITIHALFTNKQSSQSLLTAPYIILEMRLVVVGHTSY